MGRGACVCGLGCLSFGRRGWCREIGGVAAVEQGRHEEDCEQDEYSAHYMNDTTKRGVERDGTDKGNKKGRMGL